MEITFDPEKDRANRAKHGVGLARAAELDWATAHIEADERRSYGETRYIAWAMLEDRLHACVFTLRDGLVRVISLRKANRREERRYHESQS